MRDRIRGVARAGKMSRRRYLRGGLVGFLRRVPSRAGNDASMPAASRDLVSDLVTWRLCGADGPEKPRKAPLRPLPTLFLREATHATVRPPMSFAVAAETGTVADFRSENPGPCDALRRQGRSQCTQACLAT